MSVVVGDRMCVQCGYNLTGQAVLREPHYDMLIVRCPECAMVAAVQEYPLLGRWANRWAALLAALWFLFLVVLWAGSGAAIFAVNAGVTEFGSHKYGRALTDQWQAWQVALSTQAATQPSRFMYQPGVNDFMTWWKTQDQTAALNKAGGPIGAINWVELVYLGPAILVAPLFGCIWATVLFSRRGPPLLCWSLAIMAVAAAFSLMLWLSWREDQTRSMWHGYSVAIWTLGTPLLIGAFVVQGILLALGMLIGRPVMRWLLRLLLPPRLCGSLSFLWLADGLNPPRVTVKSPLS